MTTLLVCALLQAGPFELKDGDRVAFVGNTFFERDLRHGRLETALTARWPDRAVAFRNFGWDGDTVWGHARAEFGSPKDGFAALSKHVSDAKPTVIFVAYGMAESFDGPKGVEPFAVQLEAMLDMLSRTQARLVLLSPVRHEDKGRPLPDPAAHNASLRLYADAVAKAAARRGLTFVDLFAIPLPTVNGVHLADEGYLLATTAIEKALGLPALDGPVDVGAAPATLPVSGSRTFRKAGLAPGRYVLKAGGAAGATGTAEEWAKGVAVSKGPAFDQADKLRAAIAMKNLVHFQSWRPHNDTYIFGFRRKEQGHLTAEFPKFPELIAEHEASVAKLRVPAPVTYTLERE